MRVLFVEHKTVWGGGQVALCSLLDAALAHPEAGIEPLLVCPPDAALLPRARTWPVPVHVLNLGRIQKSPHPWMWAWNLYERLLPTLALVRLVRRAHVDVVFANGAYSFLASVGAAKLTRTPILWSEHNTTLPRGAILSGMIRAADQIMVVADVIRQQFIELVPAASRKVTTVYNGVEVERYRASQLRADQVRASLGLVPNALVVGTVGRLSPEKGQELLLQAASLIRNRVPNVQFLCIGEGPSRSALESQARVLDLNSNIVFTGFRDKVPELLQGIDIFVLPSRAEAFPLALLEAMAAGKPVVAADVGGVREAVVEGETGYLCEPGDVQRMAARIVSLLGNAELRAQMGACGRARVAAEFTLDRTWQKTLDVIRRAAARGAA